MNTADDLPTKATVLLEELKSAKESTYRHDSISEDMLMELYRSPSQDERIECLRSLELLVERGLIRTTGEYFQDRYSTAKWPYYVITERGMEWLQRHGDS